jgi:hypothetical protein
VRWLPIIACAVMKVSASRLAPSTAINISGKTGIGVSRSAQPVAHPINSHSPSRP